MIRKTLQELDVELKALTDPVGEPTGEITFYAASFGTVDLIGDRVMPGAFTKSLEKWRRSGDPIPVVFSHSWDDPNRIIGSADPNECHEDPKGLFIKAQLDIDDNATAKVVFKQIQKRVVKEASFAYDVIKERKAKDGANELIELNIIEVGPCLKGMNPSAGDFSTKRDLFAEIERIERQAYPAPTAQEADMIIAELDRRAKSGARNSQADLGLLQEIHDRTVKLGASCEHVPADDYETKHASRAQVKALFELFEIEQSIDAAEVA